jgi:hypothetical protein
MSILKTLLGEAQANATPFKPSTDIPKSDVQAAVDYVYDYAAAGYQPLDSELTALASTTSAADAVPYFTGSGTATTATLTSFARTLLDDTTAATARDTLGVSEGANQTYTVHVADYGAVGDADSGGTTGTDDTTAFQNAINAVNTAGGGIVYFSKRHLIDSALTVKSGVMLKGPIPNPGQPLPISTANFDDNMGVLYLNSAGGITVNSKGGVSDCYIVRKGVEGPYGTQVALETAIAAFAGTAVTINNHDGMCENLFIVGFTQAISNTGASAPSRARIENVQFDCTNGILIDNCFDIAYVADCHAKPYLSSYYNSLGGAGTWSVRSGTAYKCTVQNDWGKFTNCFSYAWANGFDIDAADSITLLSCGADYPAALASTSVGFRIYTGAGEARLIGCQAAAQGTGYHIENGFSASQAGVVTLTGCTGWGQDTQHVYVVSGRAIITGCSFRSGTYAVIADSTAGALTIAGNEFDTVTTPLSIHATPLALSQVYGNRTYNCTNPLADEVLRLRAETAASSALEVINTADSTPVRVGRFRGIRPTPANNDTIYTDWELSDSAGNTTVALRQNVRLSDVTNTSEDAQVFWSLMVGGTITDKIIFTNSGWSPVTNDGMALGTSSLGWADLHGATGFVWNIANGNAVVTHSSGVFTVSTGDWRITTAGTNAASAVTVGGTQTLTAKTLTAPVLTSYVVASLPAGSAGALAFASNGRKNGEGGGAGTGVLVFFDGTNWCACDTGATVAA